jgi:predicted kinase
VIPPLSAPAKCFLAPSELYQYRIFGCTAHQRQRGDRISGVKSRHRTRQELAFTDADCHLTPSATGCPPVRRNKPGMRRAHLIIVCGVPGSGKSTFALHAADRWGAVRFASETFAEELGAAARTASGDLSKEAIIHAYSAMGAAVTDSLAINKLVVAVGSFRSEEQRRRFRDIAKCSGASVTTLRIVCPVETAAKRIRSRLASGERGPTEKAILQIDAELNQARDIDAVLTNDSSVEHFNRRVDEVIQALELGSDHDASTRPQA